MMFSTALSFFVALLVSSSTTFAHPASLHGKHVTHARFHERHAPPDSNGFLHLTIPGLELIAPSSTSCEGAEFPDECRTAAQALPYITQSFEDFNITHAPVQAALVALMAYESGEFRYNVNHWPGRPGQGTRNMQMADYNEKYAQYLGNSASTAMNVTEMMDTVGSDEHTFGSAAWFITTQCPYSVREAMWDATQSSWENYLTSCVGADPNESGRLTYWQNAMTAYGQPN